MLNETERLIVECQIMRLSEKEALAYLKANGHQIESAWYYRLKGRIEGQYMKQLYEIAQRFPYLHIERVREIDLIRSQMWRNYHLEEQPYRKACILKMILELQPYASAYSEATKEIIEGELARGKEKGNPIPDISEPSGK